LCAWLMAKLPSLITAKRLPQRLPATCTSARWQAGRRASTIGYRSVAIPGTVAGLALALKNVWHHETRRRDCSPPSLGRTRLSVSEETWPGNWTRSVPACQRFSTSSRIFLNGGSSFTPEIRCATGTRGHLKRIAKNGPDRVLSRRDRANAGSRHGGSAGSSPSMISPITSRKSRSSPASYPIDAHRWKSSPAPPPKLRWRRRDRSPPCSKMFP